MASADSFTTSDSEVTAKEMTSSESLTTSGSEVTVKEVNDSESPKSTTIKNEETEEKSDEINTEGKDQSDNEESEDIEDLNYKTIGFEEKIAHWSVKEALEANNGKTGSDTYRGYKESVTPGSQSSDDDSIRAASAIRAGFSTYSEMERELRRISMCVNVKVNLDAEQRFLRNREVQTSRFSNFDEIEDSKVDKSTHSNDDNLLDCLIQKWTFKKYFRSVKAQTDNDATGSNYSIEVREEDPHSDSDEMNVYKQMERLSSITKKTTATGSSEEELLKYKFQSIFNFQYNEDKLNDNKRFEIDEKVRARGRWIAIEKPESIKSFSNRTRSSSYSSRKSLPRFATSLGILAIKPKPVSGTDLLTEPQNNEEWHKKVISLSANFQFIENQIEELKRDVIGIHEYSSELLNSLHETSLVIHKVVDKIQQKIRTSEEQIYFIKRHQGKTHESLQNIKRFFSTQEKKIRKIFK